MKITQSNLLKVYIFIVTLNIFLFTSLHFLFPELNDFLFQEDKLVENLSAIFFLLSFFPGIIYVSRFKEEKNFKVYLALPFIGLIGFLDELGFGDRIFNFDLPIIYGEKFDAVHDIVTISYTLLKIHGSALLFFSLITAFCIIIFSISFKYRKYFSKIPDVLREYPPFGFFLICAGFLLSAQVFDLHFELYLLDAAAEEVLEMNGALTLLFAVFSTRYAMEENKQAKGVGSETMKNMPIFVGIMFIFFISGTLISYCYLSSRTNKLETESREYVERIIPLIFTSWDSEEIIDHMSSEIHQREEYHKLVKNSFDKLSDISGLLIDFEITKGQIREKGKIPNLHIKEQKVIFNHFAKLIFENNQARVQIVTILERDRWRILGIKIYPIETFKHGKIT